MNRTRTLPCLLGLAALYLVGCGFEAPSALPDLGATNAPAPDDGADDDPDDTPPPGCGDGVPSGSEACDDGNNRGGDGCSASCSIEPAHVCDDDGCQRVFELDVAPPFARIGVVGLEELEGASCTSGVLVGFTGRRDPNFGTLIGVRGVCSTLPIAENGRLDWEGDGFTDTLGANSGPMVGASLCAPGELMIGSVIHSDVGLVVGIAPLCALANVRDGELELGSTVVREILGEDGLDSDEAACDDGEGVGSSFGLATNATGISGFAISCGELVMVLD